VKKTFKIAGRSGGLLWVMLILSLVFQSCFFGRNSFNTSLQTVDNNVCRKLRGKVILYAVFVDTKYTKSWSDYDIKSTQDSLKVAKDWLEENAAKAGVPLSIEVVFHQNKMAFPIQGDLPGKTLSSTLFPMVPMGIKKLNHWADKVSKKAATSFPKDTSRIIKTTNQLNNRERLIARLRDQHKTDNVALMFFVNNYYQEEISVAVNTESHQETEYAVVSFKKPSVIVHEFLHLFGAWDLYISPFDRKRSIIKKKEQIMKEFPNEIMAFEYRNLRTLEISNFTKYLIGWNSEMDSRVSQKFFGKY
jgi:hypothetical protein